MHLRLRTSRRFPSGLEVFTVLKDNVEVPNTAAQALLECARPFNHSVHLQVLSRREIEPILVVEFTAGDFSCVLQESNGVAQWFVEFTEEVTSSVAYKILSSYQMGIGGNIFHRILTLSGIPELVVPKWMGEAAEDNVYTLDVYMDHTEGAVNARIMMSLVASPDAKFSELFRALCWLRSPHNLCITELGGPDLIPTEIQEQFTYDQALRFGFTLRDMKWPFNHTVWLKADLVEGAESTTEP